ncbi:flagellar brake domain-containing protein [Idiomarina aminovorans]|uniref:flagellar brake domain-containing protein n=1 Tax=Idiomarina aminovorans TaxID=2914829 RepID=UPI00200654CA|nr:flagellar brake protein [Idiomarina sp. ATCH4]MCK7458619.1 flagellar brake protein [Idiomarina sp. ATCH4]
MSSKISELVTGQKIEVQLASSNVPARFYSEFIGAVKDRWVIVNMPDAKKYNSARELLDEKTPVIVRFVLENESGEICAFRSEVNYVISHPTKMLFILWPSKVEHRVIRKGRRFDAFLPTSVSGQSVKGEEKTFKGHVLDVSESGCRLKHEKLDEEVDELWENGSKITLNIEQRNNGELTLKAMVRQIKEVDDQIELGVQFMGNQKEQVKSLFSGSLVDIEELSRLESPR